jgi:hypothetical protein
MKYLIIVTLFLTGCMTQHPAECHKSLIIQVGGCDQHGFCAVVSLEGPTQVAYPVAGAESDVCFCNQVLQPQDMKGDPRICQ